MFTSIQSDEGVIRKVLRGQTDAFRVLVERYGNVVYGVAYARIGNAADAEEIAQDSFVRLYQWLDRVAGRRTVGPWLVEVARNAATDLLRRRQREVPLDRISGEAGALRAHDHAGDELRRMVWEQLGGLDDIHREVLILRYFEGLKTGEIARLLDISPAAARKRLERSRYELGLRMAEMVGEKTAVTGKETSRVRKVMAAIAAAPAAWQPSGALAVAGAAVVGASAAKIVTGMAAVAILVGLGLLAGWRHMNRPYDTQDITTNSEFVAETRHVGANAAAPAQAPTGDEKPAAASGNETADPAKPVAAIRGLVLDHALKPVAGATVTIDNADAMRDCQNFTKSANTPYSLEPVDVSQLTGVDGTFCFEQVPVAADFLFCEVRISAEKNYAYAQVVERCVGGGGDQYYELILEPAAILEGRVVNESGAGLGSAKVMVCSEGAGRFTARPFDIEANGTFTAGPLTPGYYQVITSCQGFSNQTEMLCLMPGRQRLTIQMTSGGSSISGRLTSPPDGKPVAGVTVASWCNNRQSYSGTTDESGRFDIYGLESDIYRLRLGQDADPWVIAESPAVVVPEGEAVTGVEVQAVRGAYVSGRVLDGKTGEPVLRIQMRFVAPEGGGFGTGTYPQTFTDDQGAYSLGPLVPGEYRVLLWGDFLTETSYTLPSFADVAGVDFKVAHDAAVTGTVVDYEGKPVAGASVVAVSEEMQHFATTDSGGRFSIRLAKRFLPTRLQAYSSGRASKQVGPVRGDSDHRLTLLGASQIEGTVVDQSGRPQADMLVQVGPDGPLWYPGQGLEGYAAGTSITGRFRIDFVLPGAHTLNVYAYSSLVGYPLATADVTVREGETVTARLVVNTQGLGQVEGYVLSNGAPMPGVGVAANCSGENWMNSAHGMTDVDGFYSITNLRPGRLTVSLRVRTAEGGRTTRAEEIELAAGEMRRVDFELGETNFGIEGYVTQSGVNVYPVVVVYPTGSTDDAEKMSIECGVGGYYRAAQLREGLYDVEVRDIFNPKIVHAVRREVQTRANETVRCDFELLAGAIEGTVGGLRKGEVAHVGVFPETADFSILSAALGGEVIASKLVAPGQDFRFDGLPAGVYYLGTVAVAAGSESDEAAILAAATKGRAIVQPVEVIPGQTTVADLALPQ